jgi:threonine/homoserine/homoserine lactone efflux protein
MITAVAAGTVFGLSAGLAPGPLLALVITQTLRHNVKEGMKVAVAPLVTDLPIILASLFLLSSLSELNPILGLISLAGGLYVFYLAWEGFRAKAIPIDMIEMLAPEAHSLRKGSLVNVLNPHPYLFWLTVGAPFVLNAKKESLVASLLFVGSFYAFLVGAKIFLAWLAGKSRSFLTGRSYVIVMRILAALLALFALLLIKGALTFWSLLP